MTFDWAFLAFDYMNWNDYALFKVKDSSGPVLDSIVLSDVDTVGDYEDTGWQSYEYTFASAGSGKIIFKSKNYADELYDSVFLVDNVYAGTDPVPEPATIALLGIGLAGLGWAVARRKFKKDKK